MLRPLAPITLLVLMLCGAASPAEQLLERQLYLMGTSATLRVRSGTTEDTRLAAEHAANALRQVEQRWSTWQPDSVSSLINAAAPSQPSAVPPEFARDLARVQALGAGLEQLFRLDMGALVGAWELRGAGRVPQPDELARLLQEWRSGQVVLDGNTVLRTTPSTQIEEGGFAKGVALDLALRVTRERCPGLQVLEMNLGGQWLFWSADANASWEVAVADPQHRERQIGVLRVGAGSVATSGNSERGFWQDGQRYGHLLDPRTGTPSKNEGACVVFAPDGLRADLASTACFVLGADGFEAGAVARTWLQSDVQILWIEPTLASLSVAEGEAKQTRPWLYRTSPGMNAQWRAYEP